MDKLSSSMPKMINATRMRIKTAKGSRPAPRIQSAVN